MIFFSIQWNKKKETKLYIKARKFCITNYEKVVQEKKTPVLYYTQERKKTYVKEIFSYSSTNMNQLGQRVWVYR